MKIKGTFALLAALLASFALRSQTFISTDPEYVLEKRGVNPLVTPFARAYPDTSIDFISQYFPRNYLGNYGLPSAPYAVTFSDAEPGFRLYPVPYDQDRFHERDARYYTSKGPFASLTGIAGSRQLQIFKAMYTQTFRKKFSIGVRFNRYTSQGFYRRQQTYTNNFMLTLRHTGEHDRWGFYFYLLNNSNRHQENGGITDTTLTDSTALVRKELMNVKISAASRDNRETAVMFNPWVRIGGPTDNTGKASNFLQWKARASFSTYKYIDNNFSTDGYYKHYFFDSTATRDSTHLLQVRNDLLYSFRGGPGRISFSAGYRNELNKLWQQRDSVFMNHMAIAELRFNRDADSLSGLSSVTEASYILAGPNAGNMRIASRNTLTPAHAPLQFFVNASYERRLPDYIYTNWASNNFAWWVASFHPVERSQAEAGIHGKWYGASVVGERYVNFLYFNDEALPSQYNGSFTNLAAKVYAGRVFFRHLGIYASHMYQRSGMSSICRLPPNVFTGRLYYSGFLFKRNLQLQFGGQVEVYDRFSPYAYMPATQMFYTQSTFLTGRYPYVDVFLQGRIRPVSFFLKVENVLQGFAGSNYSLVRGYYQPDRAFRLGITWMFFD